MCTAVTYKTNDFYFGRTLDNDFSYFEEVTITPRNYPFEFKNGSSLNTHYAIIGMAYIKDNYPLYYDAVNEKGLCMAGLNFVGNAYYSKEIPNKENIAVFEFIPYILSKCTTVNEALTLINNINLTDTPFNDELPVAQLHWIIADSTNAVTVECMTGGIKIYDNKIGVLTNNPPFNEQMSKLRDFMHLSPKAPQNNFCKNIKFQPYSRGMGALGLPGDLSSSSRFVRAAFVKLNSVSENDENESVGQFFHILGSVAQQRGCCEVENGKYEITVYTSCCNADKGIYYYTTYQNRQITAVDMHHEDLNSTTLKHYPLILTEQIKLQN